MNKYKCFYGRKETIVESDTTYHAQQKAEEYFKIPAHKGYLITVILVEKDGVSILHKPEEF